VNYVIKVQPSILDSRMYTIAHIMYCINATGSGLVGLAHTTFYTPLQHPKVANYATVHELTFI